MKLVVVMALLKSNQLSHFSLLDIDELRSDDPKVTLKALDALITTFTPVDNRRKLTSIDLSHASSIAGVGNNPKYHWRQLLGLFYLSDLVKLDLTGNLLGKDTYDLFTALNVSKKLQSFCLAHTGMTDKELTSLLRHLSQWPALNYILLNGNQFTPATAEAMSIELQKKSYLVIDIEGYIESDFAKPDCTPLIPGSKTPESPAGVRLSPQQTVQLYNYHLNSNYATHTAFSEYHAALENARQAILTKRKSAGRITLPNEYEALQANVVKVLMTEITSEDNELLEEAKLLLASILKVYSCINIYLYHYDYTSIQYTLYRKFEERKLIEEFQQLYGLLRKYNAIDDTEVFSHSIATLIKPSFSTVLFEYFFGAMSAETFNDNPFVFHLLSFYIFCTLVNDIENELDNEKIFTLHKQFLATNLYYLHYGSARPPHNSYLYTEPKDFLKAFKLPEEPRIDLKAFIQLLDNVTANYSKVIEFELARDELRKFTATRPDATALTERQKAEKSRLVQNKESKRREINLSCTDTAVELFKALFSYRQNAHGLIDDLILLKGSLRAQTTVYLNYGCSSDILSLTRNLFAIERAARISHQRFLNNVILGLHSNSYGRNFLIDEMRPTISKASFSFIAYHFISDQTHLLCLVEHHKSDAAIAKQELFRLLNRARQDGANFQVTLHTSAIDRGKLQEDGQHVLIQASNEKTIETLLQLLEKHFMLAIRYHTPANDLPFSPSILYEAKTQNDVLREEAKSLEVLNKKRLAIIQEAVANDYREFLQTMLALDNLAQDVYSNFIAMQCRLINANLTILYCTSLARLLAKSLYTAQPLRQVCTQLRDSIQQLKRDFISWAPQQELTCVSTGLLSRYDLTQYYEAQTSILLALQHVSESHCRDFLNALYDRHESMLNCSKSREQYIPDMETKEFQPFILHWIYHLRQQVNQQEELIKKMSEKFQQALEHIEVLHAEYVPIKETQQMNIRRLYHDPQTQAIFSKLQSQTERNAGVTYLSEAQWQQIFMQPFAIDAPCDDAENRIVHLACRAGQFSLVTWLVATFGANLATQNKAQPYPQRAYDIQGPDGNTYQHFLVKHGRIDLAVNYLNSLGEPVLQCRILKSQLNIEPTQDLSFIIKQLPHINLAHILKQVKVSLEKLMRKLSQVSVEDLKNLEDALQPNQTCSDSAMSLKDPLLLGKVLVNLPFLMRLAECTQLFTVVIWQKHENDPMQIQYQQHIPSNASGTRALNLIISYDKQAGFYLLQEVLATSNENTLQLPPCNNDDETIFEIKIQTPSPFVDHSAQNSTLLLTLARALFEPRLIYPNDSEHLHDQDLLALQPVLIKALRTHFTSITDEAIDNSNVLSLLQKLPHSPEKTSLLGQALEIFLDLQQQQHLRISKFEREALYLGLEALSSSYKAATRSPQVQNRLIPLQLEIISSFLEMHTTGNHLSMLIVLDKFINQCPSLGLGENYRSIQERTNTNPEYRLQYSPVERLLWLRQKQSPKRIDPSTPIQGTPPSDSSLCNICITL